MTLIKVKNGKGTSERELPQGYTSFLRYWEMKKGKANLCLVNGCDNKAEVGAHVYKVSENFYPKSPKLEPPYYIVPMCKGCNNYENEEEMLVEVRDLVPEK